jgi:NAD(P)-dependent dehydrogenase (short-subunit alcohol dehydrogenase family)
VALDCLAVMDLAGLEARDVTTLSGGERRRLAIATVLAQDPRVFLLDEPIQQLDPLHQLGVLGPWLLTRELGLKLLASGDARVVFVSSGGMYARRLSLEDCEWRRRPYDGVAAYAQTKRMQVVMARLLAEQFPARSVTASAMHPGWADTPAVRTSLPKFWSAMRGRLRSPAEGADTVIWLAASERARGVSGRFWFDRAERSPHLLPWTRESVADRAALREFCERSTSGGAARARAA